MKALLLALTLTSWLPRPVPTLAPFHPKDIGCYIIRMDILTDDAWELWDTDGADAPRPLRIRDWMPCLKCEKYLGCHKEDNRWWWEK